MDIFETLSQAQNAVDDRANIIAKILLKLNQAYLDFELIPSFYDWRASLNAYEEQKFENGVVITEKYVQLHITDPEDVYDDFPANTFCHNLPYDLALNGTKKELALFFKNFLEDRAEHYRLMRIRENYTSLFGLDRGAVEKVIKAIEPGRDYSFKEKEQLLVECGILPQQNSDS